MTKPSTASPKPAAIPTEVGQRLGWYVYALIDPRPEGGIFYIGKGKGGRAASHLHAGRFPQDDTKKVESAKQKRIKAIRKAGFEPLVDIIRHQLATEGAAFSIEAALISTLPGLTNAVGGQDPDRYGRATLDEVVTRYGAEDLSKDLPPVVMIRLGTWTPAVEPIGTGERVGYGWKPNVSEQELYDATRAWWRINPAQLERREVDHAVAVHDGVTRAIYRIDPNGWLDRTDGRRAFTGTPVRSGKLHSAYVGRLGKRVGFGTGSQNPITYWPPQTPSGK